MHDDDLTKFANSLGGMDALFPRHLWGKASLERDARALDRQPSKKRSGPTSGKKASNKQQGTRRERAALREREAQERAAKRAEQRAQAAKLAASEAAFREQAARMRSRDRRK